MGIRHNRIFLGLVFLVVFLTASCVKKDGVEGAPPAVGEVDLGFRLEYNTVQSEGESTELYNWKKQYLRFKLHKGDSTFDEPCVAEAGEDISCVLEADEFDLHNFGFSYEYNLPPAMCEYMLHQPYYYYGQEGGTGPTAIQVDVDQNGDTGLDDGTGAGVPDDGTVDTTVDLQCPYDYSPDGPNCCGGDYTKTTRIWDINIPGYRPSVTTEYWGGNPALCLDGPPVVDPAWPKTKEGWPVTVYQWVYGIGAKTSYIVPGLDSSAAQGPRSKNVFAANWYDPASHGGNKPGAMIRESYMVACLDRDFEYVARINLYVRDWNTKADFDAMDATPAGHSSTGNESGDFSAQPLNDYDDWEDVDDGIGGAEYPGLRS